jgi:hypothetical protein
MTEWRYFEMTSEELQAEILGPTLVDQWAFFTEIMCASPPDVMYERDIHHTEIERNPMEHIEYWYWQIHGDAPLDDATQAELTGLWIKYYRARTRHKTHESEVVIPAQAHGLIHLRKLIETQVAYGWLVDIRYTITRDPLEPAYPYPYA